MEATVIKLMLLALISSVSASSCKNPLFRVETWPDGNLERPPYLKEPISISQNSLRYCYNQAGSESCCSSDTIVFIQDSIKGYSDLLSQQATQFIGRIRDTFNDFDPEVQSYKKKGRLLATFSEVDGSDLDYTLPEGRGIERIRPGILDITTEEQNSIAKAAREMNVHMLNYAEKSATCLKALVSHLTGIMCMGCNSSWEDYVEESIFRYVTLKLSQDSCDYISDECLDYLDHYQSLPELIQTYAEEIQGVLKQAEDRGRIEESEVKYADLDELFNTNTEKVCYTNALCVSYLCNNMLDSLGGLAPTVTSFVDPFNYEKSRRLRLSNDVTYQYTTIGYDSTSQGETSGLSLDVTVEGQSTYIESEDSSVWTYMSVCLLSMLLV